MKKKSTEEILKEYNLTEAWLRDNYEVKEKSLTDIQKETGVPFGVVLSILRRLNIRTRNISEAAATQRYKDKKKATLAPLGVTNVSQLPEVQKKKEQTFLKHYGVTNIRKSKDFCLWLDNFCLKKYGKKRVGNSAAMSRNSLKWWASMSDTERENRIRRQLKNIHSGNNSKLEKNFSTILDTLDLDYQRHFYLGRFQFDYRILNTQILIEINGDFWHANPSVYKENDIINLPRKPQTAKQIWEKDAKKNSLAEMNGFKVLSFWEKDLKSKSMDHFFDEIKKHI